MSDKDTSDRSPAPNKGEPLRKFLVVVDGTPESEVALKFAARRALHTNGVVALFAILEPGDFQHWLGVESIMREEARQEAEAILHRLAAQVNDLTGRLPELIIREGKKAEQLKELIEEDHSIAILVLAAGTGKEGPGPLVQLVASAAENAFPIPVTVVPGSLTDEEIEVLA